MKVGCRQHLSARFTMLLQQAHNGFKMIEVGLCRTLALLPVVLASCKRPCISRSAGPVSACVLVDTL
jgi:hypothetical protein